MTILAQTTTGTLLYRITGGPVTFPVQTNNTFSSLPAGTYVVEVSNTANEIQTTIVTVTGNYQLPDFVPAVANPHCPDSSTGSLIGHISLSTGLSPYTWELIAPSAVTRPQQLSDTFSSLPAGTYTIRVTDGCNNVQTKTVIMSTMPVPLNFYGGYARITGCDTAELHLSMMTPAYRPPYKITYTVGGSSYSVDTAAVDNEESFSGYLTVHFTVPHISYGGLVTNITVTNSCGSPTVIPQANICPFMFTQNFTPVSVANCQSGILTGFSIGNPACNLGVFPKFPLTVTIRDMPANNVVEIKTYPDPMNFSFSSVAMAPGSSYKVTMEDSCHHSYTGTVSTPSISRYVDLSMSSQQTMLDSTTIVYIFARGFPTQGTTLTITGGPASAHSTKHGYAYSENYVYPKTFTGQLNSDSSTTFSMNNTAPGTYTYVVTDSCGNQFPGTFQVTSSDVSDFKYSYNYQKGCAGSSGLQYELVHNTFSTVNITDIATSTVIHSAYGWQMSGQNPYSNVANNITAADYELAISYGGSGAAHSMNNILVDVFTVKDTIHITPYQNPALKTSASSLCSGDLFLALAADSSKGIPPYQYEIISGPQTFPPQASNFFQLTQTGNYTIRLTDNCGNSVSANVTVNPVSFPPLSSLGSICINAAAMLTYGASTYFSYTWTKPNGSTYAGDTLFIDPVTPADTGVYTIQRITTINGCSNTETTTYRLSGAKQDSAAKAICRGQTFTFGSRVLTQTGIYRDTFPTTGCDSISILNLTVNDFKKDSTARTICRGQNFVFGSRMLTETGIYRDTMSTSTCDSISVLNLTVNELKDSSAQSICRGRSFIFGSRTLTESGIYRDTISTSTCDSISILNLTVNELKRDSSAQSICRGRSFTFGSRTLTESGIYRDTISTSTCDSISILNLTVNELKRDSSAQSICRGRSFTFGSRTLTESGIYRDTISTSACDSISILNLTVNELKRDSSAQSICRGQNFIFGSRTLTETGIYRDTLATAGCDSIVVLNLSVNDFKKDSSTAAVCLGQQFIFGSRVLTAAGVYRDTISTAGCDSIAILNLVVNDIPVVQIQADKNPVTAGAVIQLTAAPGNLSSYLWTSSNSISRDDIYNPTSIVSMPSWYKVTVTDINNCSNTDSLFIALRADSIFTCDGHTVIHIPTAFTPNGDEQNDQFRILGLNNVAYKSYRLLIYNRWGELIFETNNSTQAWDGRYKGSPANIGNYVYFFHFICADGKTYTRKGNVMLLR